MSTISVEHHLNQVVSATPTEATTDLVVLNQSNTRSWKDFAGLINTTWRKGVTAFIDTGRYLLDAKAELDRDVFESLVKRHLNFDPSVGRKLMAIAGNSVICAHGHELPPCWTTIYELSKADDEVLQAKFADGTINPGIDRKTATALRRQPNESEVAAESTIETDNSAGETRVGAELAGAETLAQHWARESEENRRAALDEIGIQAILDVMSDAFGAALRARVPKPEKRKNLTANPRARHGKGFRH